MYFCKEKTKKLIVDSILTLYELNTLVRETVEDGMSDTYWVQGELSEGRQGYGGHFYGEMVQRADDDSYSSAGRGTSPRHNKAGQANQVAKARVTCWAQTWHQVSQKFEEATGHPLQAGMKVLAEVSVTFHQQYGYSLNVLDIDPSYTLGDAARRRREILHQLEQDGILHDNQTLPIPMLARRVAVVSSASAAGYGDFCNQLENNDYGFHFELSLFPAVMQGARVEETVISALERISREQDRWDVVVIIRGGGATSDLADFDSYPLAACVAQMPLPIITGIGHERDETVLDHVAHTHLKTPTAVASFLIEHMADTAVRLEELGRKIGMNVTEQLTKGQHRMELLEQRFVHDVSNILVNQRHRIDMLDLRLKGVNPDLLLQRGYSMTLVDGRLLRDVSQLAEGKVLTTRIEHGEINSIVQSWKKN